MLKKLEQIKVVGKKKKPIYLNVLTNVTGTLSEHKFQSSTRSAIRDISNKKGHFNNNRKHTRGRKVQHIEGITIYRYDERYIRELSKPNNREGFFLKKHIIKERSFGKVIKHETNPKKEVV